MGLETGYLATDVTPDGRYDKEDARAYAAERGFMRVAAKKTV